MKKGFMHIVEIIIVVLLVFVILFQFGYMPGVKSDWPGTKMYLLGGDLLYSLDREGVNWFDAGDVDDGISPYLGTNTEYELSLKNVIKPDILVGCICSPAEYADVLDSLNFPPAMGINGATIRFDAERLEPASPEFSVKYDVIIIGQTAFDAGLAQYANQIGSFLSYDKGMIELVDIELQEEADQTQTEIFNLAYQSSLSSGGGDISFAPQDSTYNIIPPIEKYFYHFPNASGDFYQEANYFDNLLAAGEKINVSDGVSSKMILTQASTGRAACVINYNMVENVGRTAWLSRPSGSLPDDAKVFIRALAAWAAGDTYDLRTSFFTKGQSVSFSLFKVLNEDMYQPIEIMFTIGNVYVY